MRRQPSATVPCQPFGFPEPGHRRRDRRVIVSKIARARRLRPATPAGRSGDLGEIARESGTGPVLGFAGRGGAAGGELGTGEGVMTGKSCVASPASMSVLPTPFRSGIGPSGSSGSGRRGGSGGLRDRTEITSVRKRSSSDPGRFELMMW